MMKGRCPTGVLVRSSVAIGGRLAAVESHRCSRRAGGAAREQRAPGTTPSVATDIIE